MINYELKKTFPGEVTLNNDGSATIKQRFLTGVVGTPDSYKMLAGDSIEINIPDYANKTIVEADTIVNAAVAAFIAQKYPST